MGQCLLLPHISFLFPIKSIVFVLDSSRAEKRHHPVSLAPEPMTNAVKAVISGSKGHLKASKQFPAAQTTMEGKDKHPC